MHTTEPITAPAPPLFELFWEEHRQKLLVALLVTFLLLCLAGGALLWNHSRQLAAEALFFSASDKQGWEAVVARYPHSEVAANALLLIAQAETQEKNYAAAKETYTRFLERFSQQPFAITALLGKAMNDDAAGNTQAAVDEFQQAASAYPQSYGAPFALMMEARLLVRLGKKEEAKRVLQMLSNQYPDSLVNRVMLQQGSF